MCSSATAPRTPSPRTAGGSSASFPEAHALWAVRHFGPHMSQRALHHALDRDCEEEDKPTRREVVLLAMRLDRGDLPGLADHAFRALAAQGIPADDAVIEAAVRCGVGAGVLLERPEHRGAVERVVGGW